MAEKNKLNLNFLAGLGSGNGSDSPFQRLESMMNSSFDRGNGAGIKTCTIEFADKSCKR